MLPEVPQHRVIILLAIKNHATLNLEQINTFRTHLDIKQIPLLCEIRTKLLYQLLSSA